MENKEELWKTFGSISKDVLSIFGVIATLGLFIAYYILTSYIIEIGFSVGTIETHLIFSIAKKIIIFFLILSMIIVMGTFFPYRELKQYDNREILLKLWWTSSLIIIAFLLIGFMGAIYINLSSFGLLIYLCVLALGAGIIEYKFINNIVKKETLIMVLWQIVYSLIVVYSFLLGLLLKTKIEWFGLVVVSISLIIIHSYIYIFILFSSKPWRKYILFLLTSFPVILLLISLNSFREFSIRDSNIGGIEYKKIKINDDECKYLNKYYDSKPCNINTNLLTDMKGLWLQGSVQYFQNKNGKYKVKTDHIIYKVL